jgi:hypothetical protein
VMQLPFDSGYGAKSNAAAKVYERAFVLRASDDFDFTAEAAEGVRRLLDILRSDKSVGIASGRLDNNPYECLLTHSTRPDGLKDMVATLHSGERLFTSNLTPYWYCDFTVNYSLVRTSLILKHRWDERFKIGGDHLDLYLTAAQYGWRTAACSMANINSLNIPRGSHPTYGKYRRRARLALPWTFERHGWASWRNFNGTLDTRESVARWAQDHQNLIEVQDRSVSRAQERQTRQDERQAKRARKRAKTQEGTPGMGRYGIRADYRERTSVPHFDAVGVEGEWQAEVYGLAETIYREQNLDGVIDIGCGDGGKLIKHFQDTRFLGVEVEPTLLWLRNNRQGEFSDTVTPQYDLAICADVIEHVLDPDALLDEIDKSGFRVLVISTPARELIPGALYGPPQNPSHVREWTQQEFHNYLSQRYRVIRHYISNAAQYTQVAVCEPLK